MKWYFVMRRENEIQDLDGEVVPILISIKMNQPPMVKSQEILALPLNSTRRTSLTKDLAFRQPRAQAHV